MVADETITAFGRIGDMFAMNRFGVTPDIITCGQKEFDEIEGILRSVLTEAWSVL